MDRLDDIGKSVGSLHCVICEIRSCRSILFTCINIKVICDYFVQVSLVCSGVFLKFLSLALKANLSFFSHVSD